MENIIVFGELKTTRRLPDFKTEFLPILKTSAKINVLSEFGYNGFPVKIRNLAKDYETPDIADTLHPFDNDNLSMEEKRSIIKSRAETKSKWETTILPYQLDVYTSDILFNLGFENQKELNIKALSDYLQKQRNEFDSIAT